MTYPASNIAVERTTSTKWSDPKQSLVVDVSRSSIVGRVVRRRINSEQPLKYFLYIPHTAGSNPKLLVSVHGISRNAKQHATCFAKIAEKYGVVVVAPYFSRKRFSGYQRLGFSAPARADLAFQEIIEDVRRLTGAMDKIHLFGYSGGAQFAHRYAMVYPQQIERLVVGAAGWYTFPDDTRRYPFGTLTAPRLPEIVFDADQYLQVPIRVIVGGWDIHSDAVVNRRRKIDRQQGKSRLERASRWIFQMDQKAAARGITPQYELIVLRRCGHDFRACVRQGELDKHVMEFCFGNASCVSSGTRTAKCDLHEAPA